MFISLHIGATKPRFQGQKQNSSSQYPENSDKQTNKKQTKNKQINKQNNNNKREKAVPKA